MSWSPFTDEVLNDPASGHRELLDRCPVHHCEAFDPPFYTLSRYADVAWALREIDLFSSQHGQGPRFTPPQGMMCDPPQHTTMRRLLQPAFTPKAMAALRPRVEALADELVDRIMSGPEVFDLHDDLAFPLPVIVIAGLLGVPTEDLDRFKYWSDIQVAAMGAEDPSEYASEQSEFNAYLRQHLRSRRRLINRGRSTPDDLLTHIAAAPDPKGGLLNEADALSLLTQLLVGGNETTTSLITNVVWRLLERPTLWRALVEDPGLATGALEESLRFDPPVLGLYRNTTRAVSLHGVTIPAESKVYLNYAAANRDPDVFVEPDEFQLDRQSRRHLAFGLGVHFCLGAPMARLEGEIALRTLARRLPRLALAGPGERIAPFFLWGRRTLPISQKG